MNTHFPWLDRREYPFGDKFFAVNGTRMHYIDEGKGETLLFVHGTPSWSFDFRNVIKALSPSFRCIAPDHIGFGLSGKPADYDYSTQKHAATLEAFIRHLDLRDITLVVHDFGGPIALDYALRHPDKVKRIVVLNSWMWSVENDPDFIKMRRILRSPLLPFLYRYLNFSAKYLLPQSFAAKEKLRPEIHRHYTAPFSRASERLGTLAFANSLLNDQDWFGSLWEKRKTLAAKPALLLWGMKDSFIGPEYLLKFESIFPDRRSIRLENCGHFPQEEEYETVAKEIRDFCRTRG